MMQTPPPKNMHTGDRSVPADPSIGEAFNEPTLLVRQQAAASPKRDTYPYMSRQQKVQRKSPLLPYRPPPGPAVSHEHVASWQREGTKVSAKTAAAAELTLRFLCWGMFRRRFSGSVDGPFQDSVRQLLKNILLEQGAGATGREAIKLSFPEGVPTDEWLMRERNPGEPSLVLNVTLRLKGTACLQVAKQPLPVHQR